LHQQFSAGFVTEFLNNILFIFQRFDAQSAVDILLVTAIFFGLMYWLRDTQAIPAALHPDGVALVL
jgi:hypothetical protein